MAKKTAKDESERLFLDPSGQRRMFGKSLQQQLEDENAGGVECLGKHFADDAARREHFTDLLREKLADPKFRKIEGFPVGDDAEILAWSDPPFFTLCPNPFLGNIVGEYATPYDAARDNYRREPFSADVSEGKTDSIYTAHSYHTKVPHKAIMRYILHYTNPGDVVLDGFSGTGMTGVASHLCGDKEVVESLGYTIQRDGRILDAEGVAISSIGARHAILNDLSPAAAFISANYNIPVSIHDFQRAARDLLKRFESAFGWMYETRHPKNGAKGRINYTVWSDVFLCSSCQHEIVFWHDAVEDGEVKEDITCPSCKAKVAKTSLERAMTAYRDAATGKNAQRAKRKPVLINYTVAGTRYEKEPDAADLKLIERIETTPVDSWYPDRRIDGDIDLWYERDYRSLGIYSVDALFTRRNLIMVAWFRREISKIGGRLGSFLWYWFESVLMGFSLLNRYLKNAFSQVNRILSGTLYVGSMQSEVSPWYSLEGKIGRFKVFDAIRDYNVAVSTGSTTALQLPNDCIDYVFVDPPFGSNIIYSDLSIVWEAWLRVATRTDSEAVVHRRKKTNAFQLPDYAELMARCFAEMYRVLKPNRWITIEFHNSRNSVWTAIQEALMRAGFIVADVRTLDKQMETFKQVTAAGAVKQDLVISAYKPERGFEKRFKVSAGSEDGMWDFVRSHLRQLPVFVQSKGEAEIVAERQKHLLFDRMVAFHVQRGVSVPMSAGDFYAGLAQRFVERDGMYLLQDQAAEYDRKRSRVTAIKQLQLFVIDEATAIEWLRQQLGEKPQTFRELQPQFMKEVAGWEKHEQPLELMEMLRQNFLCYDGTGEVPNPIHAYLSSNFKELRSLPKNNASLREKARDRWYVPDPNKAGDLEKLRERALLAEFEEYKASKQRNLKVFRTEAVRAGFKAAYDRQDYKTVVAVAAKLPESVLQEDEKLLMYYDVATMRLGDADKDKLFQ